MRIPETPEAAAISLRFGVNLTEHRRRAELSEIATAERAVLFHPGEVALLELGLRVPDLPTILKVAGAVDTEPGELLKAMDWQLDPAKTLEEATS